MGWLTEARQRVKDLLTPADNSMNVWDYNPERVITPAIAVTYGTPLLNESETFGSYILRQEVTLLPARGTNESVTDALDRMIENSVVKLEAADYGIEQVGQPYMLSANNAMYLAVDIVITELIEPTEGE